MRKVVFQLDPSPVVAPGTLPSALLEQADVWIDPQGYQHRIEDLDEDFVLFVLDHLMANARRLRDQWAAELLQDYDEGQRARRWMLERPVMVALMRQRVALADKHNIESAFEEASS